MSRSCGGNNRSPRSPRGRVAQNVPANRWSPQVMRENYDFITNETPPEFPSWSSSGSSGIMDTSMPSMYSSPCSTINSTDIMDTSMPSMYQSSPSSGIMNTSMPSMYSSPCSTINSTDIMDTSMPSMYQSSQSSGIMDTSMPPLYPRSPSSRLMDTSMPSLYESSGLSSPSRGGIMDESMPSSMYDSSSSVCPNSTGSSGRLHTSTTIITEEEEEDDESDAEGCGGGGGGGASPRFRRHSNTSYTVRSPRNGPNATYPMAGRRQGAGSPRGGSPRGGGGRVTYNLPPGGGNATYSVMSDPFASTDSDWTPGAPLPPYSTFNFGQGSWEQQPRPIPVAGPGIPVGAAATAAAAAAGTRRHYSRTQKRVVTETPSEIEDQFVRGVRPGAQSTPKRRGKCPASSGASGSAAINMTYEVSQQLNELEASEREQINNDLSDFQQARRRWLEDTTTMSSASPEIPANRGARTR